jgi:hypothetical protein
MRIATIIATIHGHRRRCTELVKETFEAGEANGKVE